MLTTWIFLAVLLFWAVGAYNRLVRLRSAAIQAFGGLDVHFVRITGMLGEYEAAQSPALPAQSEVRTALWAATTQFGACLAVARARPLDAGAA
ncbi:LemA family protein, partial [Paracidovorax cattleyae]